jgi:hypothetical protein
MKLLKAPSSQWQSNGAVIDNTVLPPNSLDRTTRDLINRIKGFVDAARVCDRTQNYSKTR